MRKLEQVHDKSYTVFGMGEFGKNVAIELARAGADVCAIDNRQERLEDVADYVTDAKILDASDIHSYAKLGLETMDGVVIAMSGNMNAELMALLQSEEASVPNIVVKAINDTQEKIFEKMGATMIITPEKSGGIRLARTLVRSNVFDFVELRDHVCMLEIAIQEDWNGKSLRELNLRSEYNINVIALVRDGVVCMSVDPDEKLSMDTHLLVATDKDSARKFDALT